MPTKIFSIYPAIGVARVGNAERTGNDFFFVGPELPDVLANLDSAGAFRSFKVNGKVKPQAARFRLFEYERADDGSDKLIGEVKLGERGISAIKWTVHLANRKASFCNFAGQKGAEDKPYFKSYRSAAMRNDEVKGSERRARELELDPGAKSIAGGDIAAVVDFAITQPALKKIKTLGQLRSDADGRLIVLGGLGLAEAFPKADAPIEAYDNNPGWFDDVSDGPVTAELTVEGQAMTADTAWVVVGPPDFAPSVRSYRTMYDTLVDVYARNAKTNTAFAKLSPDIEELRQFWENKDSAAPVLPSFTKHIYPILASVARIIRVHENKSDNEPNYHRPLDPTTYGRLGGQNFNANVVGTIFGRIRDPEAEGEPDPFLMPLIYGDYYGKANKRGGETDPRYLHSVSMLQYALLKAWRDGKFVKDWTGVPKPSSQITPDGLTRAALEGMVGGAFFPGIEAGWLFTKPEVFAAPFRIAAGKAVGSIPVVPDGAGKPARVDLTLKAGSFSQQMAQPWHADFLDCARDGHFQNTMIGWWPVQRPDDVYVQGTA
jgi:hypothetical protein